MEKNIQGHRLQVKWPKSNSKKEWAKIDADLIKILNGIKGSVEKKLEKMGDLIYSYGAERFGAKEMGKKHVTSILPKSRRQQQIERLVRERRDWEAMEEIFTGGKSRHRPPTGRSKGMPRKVAESRKSQALTQKEREGKNILLQGSLQICERTLH